MIHIPDILYRFARIFKEANYQCFLVGGAVRDILRGKKITDFDIATDALPEDVMKLFRKVIPTGIKHGTVTVLFENDKVEVTTFRIDGKYEDSRRPESVAFTRSINEDLSRRDFTVNGIAFDLIHKKILDLFEGQKDLKNKIIRAIGTPLERFNEDGLRLLRACRFAARFNFEIEPETKTAMKAASANLKGISAERIRDELSKIVISGNPVYGFELMRETDLLCYVIPELLAGYKMEQRSMHAFDVYYHSLYACEGAPQESLELRMAALLHDIGKGFTMQTNEAGEPIFYNHDMVSAEKADEILFRLKFPNNFRTKVVHLVKQHMFNYTKDWTDSAVRRFISRVGGENIRDLIQLRMADKYGMKRSLPENSGLVQFLERIDEIMKSSNALSIKDLAVNGTDLIKTIGLPPGKTIGIILEHLLEAVIDDPIMNQKEKLLQIAVKFYEERLK